MGGLAGGVEASMRRILDNTAQNMMCILKNAAQNRTATGAALTARAATGEKGFGAARQTRGAQAGDGVGHEGKSSVTGAPSTPRCLQAPPRFSWRLALLGHRLFARLIYFLFTLAFGLLRRLNLIQNIEDARQVIRIRGHIIECDDSLVG